MFSKDDPYRPRPIHWLVALALALVSSVQPWSWS